MTGPYSWQTKQGAFTTHLNTQGPGVDTLGTEEIVDGSTTYDENGGPSAGWQETTLAVPRPAPSLVLGIYGGSNLGIPIDGLVVSDPAAILQVLETRASSIVGMGRVNVGSVINTRFRATIPFTRLGALPAQVSRNLAYYYGSSALHVDYWVDQVRHLRQVRFSVTVRHAPWEGASKADTGPERLFPLTYAISLRFQDYGVSVHAEPPPAGAVSSRESCSVTFSGESCDES